MTDDVSGGDSVRSIRLERYADEVVSFILEELRKLPKLDSGFEQFTVPRRYLLSTWERGRSRSRLLQELIEEKLRSNVIDSDSFHVSFDVGLVLDDDSGEVTHYYVECNVFRA